MSCTLVTGPARSGKSRFAESLARASGGAVTYVATARVDSGDAQWTARLARHAASRPPDWRVVETACPDAQTLIDVARAARPGETLLVESLGTWLADRMSRHVAASEDAAALDADILEAEAALAVDALLASRARAIVVGEEVGWGLVAPYAAGRVFSDVLGRAQQRLAARASPVYLVVAGFALDLCAVGKRVD